MLASRTVETAAGPARVLALPTEARRIVSFSGSLLTLPAFADDAELEQQLVARLFHTGTRRRDRFALAEFLEDRGAELEFGSAGLRLSFEGRCLAEDLPDVLALAAEELREPAFDPDEFAKAVARQAAALERAEESAAAQAQIALARRFYAPAHPNCASEPAERRERLARLRVEDAEAFYQRHVGARGLLVALAGDLDPEAASGAVRDAFDGWDAPEGEGRFETAARPEPPGRADRPMADRTNLEVRIGQPVAVRRDADDYLPLYVGVAALGGTFSARLMSTVRDEQGLTYGIGASLRGVAVEHDGYFAVHATFSQGDLARGLAATREQLARYLAEGPTEEELSDVRSYLSGSFRVGLATTGALARVLRTNAERGFDVAYLDRFPDEVQAVTGEAVQEALARHLDLERMHTAVAGTLP